MGTKTIVFDLDDTLVYEIDYLESAFASIAKTLDGENSSLCQSMLYWYKNKENVFKNLINIYPNTSIESLKINYRNHYPAFESTSKNRNLLINLKQKGYKLGLITDGFSITQRHKMKALNIDNLFDLVIISEEFGSEKPNDNNFTIFHQFETNDYFYVGDNTEKDFITPNKLGWTTICLKNTGKNIHQQNFKLDLVYLPKIIIDNLSDLNKYF